MAYLHESSFSAVFIAMLLSPSFLPFTQNTFDTEPSLYKHATRLKLFQWIHENVKSNIHTHKDTGDSRVHSMQYIPKSILFIWQMSKFRNFIVIWSELLWDMQWFCRTLPLFWGEVTSKNASWIRFHEITWRKSGNYLA